MERQSTTAWVDIVLLRQPGVFPAFLKGNAISLKAFGAAPADGSLRRSSEYVLFGHGLSTLVLQADKSEVDERYQMKFVPKVSGKSVPYWQADCVKTSGVTTGWKLAITTYSPDSDDFGQIKMLASVEGDPGQYIFLHYET